MVHLNSSRVAKCTPMLKTKVAHVCFLLGNTYQSIAQKLSTQRRMIESPMHDSLGNANRNAKSACKTFSCNPDVKIFAWCFVDLLCVLLKATQKFLLLTILHPTLNRLGDISVLLMNKRVADDHRAYSMQTLNSCVSHGAYMYV